MNIDWEKLNQLPGWLIFIPIGLFLFVIFFFAYLGELRAGRWEEVKNNKTVIDKDVAEEGLYGCGFISLFAALILGIKFNLPYLIAILLGFPVGLVICLSLAYAFYFIRRFIILIIDWLWVKRA